MIKPFKSIWDAPLGHITTAAHKVVWNQPATRPIQSFSYWAGPKARNFEKNRISNMLLMNVIEPVQNELTLPFVLAPKKDGTLQLCVDYCKRDVLAVRDSYPLPRMDECIDFLGDAHVFSNFHWQIEVGRADREKTDFTLHLGLYHFARMPCSLQKCPRNVPMHQGHHFTQR